MPSDLEILTPDSPLLAAPLTRTTDDVMQLYDGLDGLFKLMTCDNDVVQQRFYDGARDIYEGLSLHRTEVTIILLWTMF